MGENETKNPCQLREFERFLVIVNFSTLPSSFPLSSFCRFSLSAATTFHPFFVPRTLNRRISCAALLPLARSLLTQPPWPPPPPHWRPLRCRDHWAKNWKFRTPLSAFSPFSYIGIVPAKSGVCAHGLRFPQDDLKLHFCSVHPMKFILIWIYRKNRKYFIIKIGKGFFTSHHIMTRFNKSIQRFPNQIPKGAIKGGDP